MARRRPAGRSSKPSVQTLACHCLQQFHSTAATWKTAAILTDLSSAGSELRRE